MNHRRKDLVRPEEMIPVHILAQDQREEGYLVDVNNIGAFVATNLVVECGTHISIEILVPDFYGIRPLPAMVTRCRGGTQEMGKHNLGGLGLVFINSSIEEREFVQRIVMSILTHGSPDHNYLLQRMKDNETRDVRQHARHAGIISE